MKQIWIALLAVLFLMSGCAAGQTPASSSGGEVENGSSSSVEGREEGSSSSSEGTEAGSSSSAPPDQDSSSADKDIDIPPPQTYQPPAPEELFGAMPERFDYTSGAGAWATELHIAVDGSFSGLFIDSDMGDNGEGYPCGTRYFCSFSGKLSEPEQVNDYTFSTHMIELTQEDTPGEVTYADEVRYICSEPVGLAGADEILIYCPNAPVADLPEEFVWWVEISRHPVAHESNDELGRYGLYNVNEQVGFAQVGSA